LSNAIYLADHDSDKDKEYIPDIQNKNQIINYGNNSNEEIIIVNSLVIPEVKSIENNESNIVESHIEKSMYMFMYLCKTFNFCIIQGLDYIASKFLLINLYLSFLFLEVIKNKLA